MSRQMMLIQGMNQMGGKLLDRLDSYVRLVSLMVYHYLSANSPKGF